MATTKATNSPKQKYRFVEIKNDGKLVIHDAEGTHNTDLDVRDVLQMKPGGQMKGNDCVAKRGLTRGYGWTAKVEIYYTRKNHLCVVSRKYLRAAARRAGFDV